MVKYSKDFFYLRAKMYATKVGDDITKSCKGIKICVVKNEITFDDYKDCLFNKTEKYRTMKLIRSRKHELYSVEVNKKALSSYDDKRNILEDGIHTLPWGHYKIPS